MEAIIIAIINKIIKKKVKYFNKYTLNKSCLLINSNCAIKEVEIVIKQEFFYNSKIRCMGWKIFIKLRSCCSYFRKIVPWACWKVMMFNMISNVKIYNIP